MGCVLYYSKSLLDFKSFHWILLKIGGNNRFHMGSLKPSKVQGKIVFVNRCKNTRVKEESVNKLLKASIEKIQQTKEAL